LLTFFPAAEIETHAITTFPQLPRFRFPPHKS
jgi:hypothetical protein